MVKVEKELHGSWDMESTNAVNDTNIKLANAKEALRVLESRASADCSAMSSAIGGSDRVPGELTTVSAKLQAERGGLIATLDQIKRHSRNV